MFSFYGVSFVIGVLVAGDPPRIPRLSPGCLSRIFGGFRFRGRARSEQQHGFKQHQEHTESQKQQWRSKKPRRSIRDRFSWFWLKRAGQPESSTKRNQKNTEDRSHQEQTEKAREDFKRAREEQKRAEENRPQEEAKQSKPRGALEVLGLDPGYSPAELEKAYKVMRSRYHPDRFEHMSDTVKKEMAKEFQAVMESYKRLNIKR